MSDKPAQAPPKWKGDATVKGKVVDETGKPIAGAKVSFVLADVNTGFFVTTKKNGEFEANDIKTGDWRLQVDAPNFIVVRQPMHGGGQESRRPCSSSSATTALSC